MVEGGGGGGGKAGVESAAHPLLECTLFSENTPLTRGYFTPEQYLKEEQHKLCTHRETNDLHQD